GPIQPEQPALSGVGPLSLGFAPSRSYWQPRLDVYGTADSNALENSQGPAWTTWVSASAGVDVHHVSGNTNLTLSYTSGGMYSTDSTVNSGIVQGLSFVDTISFHHASLSFFDQANYLPESSFGFGSLGGASLPGSNAPINGSGFGTGQSLLTGRG